MGKYKEFMLYEELLGFFDLEGGELLSKMFLKMQELSCNYYNNENFIRNSSGDIVVFLNDYQRKIEYMFTVLVNLWFSRN